jgi:hypothetical protein
MKDRTDLKGKDSIRITGGSAPKHGTASGSWEYLLLCFIID